MSHPTRGAILRLLRRDGPLSPVRGAEERGPLGTVAHHFPALEQLGLIEISSRSLVAARSSTCTDREPPTGPETDARRGARRRAFPAIAATASHPAESRLRSERSLAGSTTGSRTTIGAVSAQSHGSCADMR